MQIIQTLFIVVHLLREFPWMQLWEDLNFDAQTIIDSVLNPIQIPQSCKFLPLISAYTDSLLSIG